MKVGSLSTQTIVPLKKTKRKSKYQLPPWAVDIPPDRVEIELLPRLRRYGRTLLRFSQWGTNRVQYEQRLALYQDQLGHIPAEFLSPEEIQEELERFRQELEQQRLLREQKELAADIPQEPPKINAPSVSSSIDELANEMLSSRRSSPFSQLELSQLTPEQKKQKEKDEAKKFLQSASNRFKFPTGVPMTTNEF